MLIEKADVSSLEQLCLNVDPNYGAMWLSCKVHPLDSTRDIFRRGARRLARDICNISVEKVKKEEEKGEGKKGGAKGEGAEERDEGLERMLDDRDCCSPLSLNSVYMKLKGEDRRRAIFGSDSIK